MKGGNGMDIITAFTEFVNSVGFPIAVCGCMMWYIKHTNDKHREEVTAINTQHKEEVHGMVEALNNNTIVLQKLCDTIGANEVNV